MNLLDLPPEIRKRIWRLLLTRPCPVEFMYEKYRTKHLKPGRGPNDCSYPTPRRTFYGEAILACHDPPFSIQILYLCRTVYREASDVLYMENKFIVRAQTIENLPVVNLSRLRFIHLHIWNLEDDNVVAAFQKMVSQIKLHPETRFALTSTEPTWETDRSVGLIKSVKSLGPVRSCSLRIFSKEIARQLGQELSPHEPRPPSTFYQYNKLPMELRLRILSYTDLVQDYRIPKEQLPRDDKRQCCNQCCDALVYCCCRHVGFSLTCTCVYRPGSFFEVSRQFRQEAIQVSFRQSTFKFHGSLADTVYYLKRSIPFAKNFRRIMLFLDYEDTERWWISEKVPWPGLYVFFIRHTNLSLLSITVFADRSLDQVPDGWDIGKEIERTLIYYRYTAGIWKSLAEEGLKHFSIHFPEPVFQQCKESFEKFVMDEDDVGDEVWIYPTICVPSST